MDFDISIIEDIPVITDEIADKYKGATAEDWCKLIGGAEYVKKGRRNYMVMKVKVIKKYRDIALERNVEVGEVFEVDKARADYLSKERGLVEVIGEVKEPFIEEAVKEKRLEIGEYEKPNIEEAVKEIKKLTTKKKTNAKK